VSDRYGRSATVKNQMIQVDAAINEGNSGGGMFNTLGQLQGVPARKYDAGGNSIFGLQQQASVDNIGMCIPINVAKPMLKTVLESYDENAIQTAQAQTPAAPRPMIGVTVRTLTAGEAQKLDGTLPNGAYVVKVEPNSPAQAAGIKKGDIIVEADGEVLTHSTHLIEVLAQHKEGDAVKLKIFRAEGTDDVASLNTIGESEYVDLEVMLQLLEDVTM
jgi:serine protease Do